MEKFNPKDRLWNVIMYQIRSNDDTKDIKNKSLNKILELCNGRIPVELYEKVFEGDIEANCFGTVDTYLFAHTPIESKMSKRCLSDVLEIITSKDKRNFYFLNDDNYTKVALEKNEIIRNDKYDEFSTIFARNNMSLFYISFYTIEHIKCKRVELLKQTDIRGQIVYWLRCCTIDGRKIQFAFPDVPDIILSDFINDFNEKVLYTTDKSTGQKVFDKDNLGIVEKWLITQGCVVERLKNKA